MELLFFSLISPVLFIMAMYLTIEDEDAYLSSKATVIESAPTTTPPSPKAKNEK